MAWLLLDRDRIGSDRNQGYLQYLLYWKTVTTGPTPPPLPFVLLRRARAGSGFSFLSPLHLVSNLGSSRSVPSPTYCQNNTVMEEQGDAHLPPPPPPPKPPQNWGWFWWWWGGGGEEEEQGATPAPATTTTTTTTTTATTTTSPATSTSPTTSTNNSTRKGTSNFVTPSDDAKATVPKPPPGRWDTPQQPKTTTRTTTTTRTASKRLLVSPYSATTNRKPASATTTRTTPVRQYYHSPPAAGTTTPSSSRIGSPPRYAKIQDIPKEYLYGRHQKPFTIEEDYRLIEILWHMYCNETFHKTDKWKRVHDADDDYVLPALHHRTPQQLKDRYRIIARNPRLLIVVSSSSKTQQQDDLGMVRGPRDSPNGARYQKPPSSEAAEALRRILQLNKDVGVPG